MFRLNKTRCDAPPAAAAEQEVEAPPKMPSVESFESKAYRKVRLYIPVLMYYTALYCSLL
jgi:hypothetical protein